MVRKIITTAVLVSSLAVVGCNTIRGLGKDVKSAGSTVENATK